MHHIKSWKHINGSSLCLNATQKLPLFCVSERKGEKERNILTTIKFASWHHLHLIQVSQIMSFQDPN